MSKFSKILAVLMTVCLLFGAITTTLASADTDGSDSLKVTANGVAEDFSGSGSYLVTSASSKHFKTENSARSAYVKYTLVTKSGNTYGRFHYANADLSSIALPNKNSQYQGSFSWIPHEAPTNGNSTYTDGRPVGADGQYTSAYSSYDLRNFDVFTYEFDLASDAYAYTVTVGGQTYYATAESEDAALAKLQAEQGVADVTGATVVNNGIAFPSSLAFTVNLDSSITDDANDYDSPSSSSKKWDHRAVGSLFVFKNGESWYIGPTKGDVTGAAQLSGEIGVFDHVTLVFKVNKNADGDIDSITPYLYVNGVYAATIKNWAPNAHGKYNMFKRMYAYIYSSVYTTTNTTTFGDKMHDKYSIAFDNMAVNYYTDSDANVEGGFNALMTELAAGNTTTPLYNVEGALFNGYPSPNGYVSVDGKFASVPAAIAELLANVQTGSVIEAKLDVTDFDVPDGVENFTVVYDPAYTEFTLCEEDVEKFLFLKNSDGSYTVRVIKETDTLRIRRVIKYGDQEIEVKLENFVFIIAPETNVEFSAFNFSDLKLYTGAAENWLADVDGNVPDAINLYNPEQLRSLTELEAALIREEFDGTLTAFATVEEGSIEVTDFSGYAYVAGYEKNGVFTPIPDSDGRYEKYKDITTLEAEKATWDEGVVYYEISNGEIQVPGGTDVSSANAVWNASSQITDAPENAEATEVTDLVKNTFKNNGTVDGYGILIIR